MEFFNNLLVMTMKNRYAKRSKISEPKFRQLVRLFALNLEATQIAELTALNRNPLIVFFAPFVNDWLRCCEQQSPLTGEIEVDEFFLALGALRENAVAVPTVKRSFSVCSNVTARSTPKLCPTAPKPRCRPLFVER